jgi:UDPglucose 6-dehydrogenase
MGRSWKISDVGEICLDNRVEVRSRSLEPASVDGFFRRLRTAVRTLYGKRIAMLGWCPGAHSLTPREAASMEVLRRILGAGCTVIAAEPDTGSRDQARLAHPGLVVAEDFYEAMNGVDAIVVMANTRECRQLDLIAAKHRVRRPILADAGPFLDAAAVREAGFQYVRSGCETGSDRLTLSPAIMPGISAALAS